jgi:hypothetical protein
MKKVSIFLTLLISIITITVFYSCNKESESFDPEKYKGEIEKLTTSETFSRHLKFIESFGTVAYDQINVKKISVKKYNLWSYFFSIPILKEGQLIGCVEVVDLKKTGFLPNNDRYAMNYINLQNFNLKTNDGNVEMMDMNYDNYLHSKVSIKGNKIISWGANGLSNTLKVKYKSLTRINYKNQPAQSTNFSDETSGDGTSSSGGGTSTSGIYILCDTNNDHNISYSECYKCATDAISSNGFSSFICEIPVLGWLNCWGTKTATCVAVSSYY